MVSIQYNTNLLAYQQKNNAFGYIQYSANHVYCRRPGPGHLLN